MQDFYLFLACGYVVLMNMILNFFLCSIMLSKMFDWEKEKVMIVQHFLFLIIKENGYNPKFLYGRQLLCHPVCFQLWKGSTLKGINLPSEIRPPFRQETETFQQKLPPLQVYPFLLPQQTGAVPTKKKKKKIVLKLGLSKGSNLSKF